MAKGNLFDRFRNTVSSFIKQSSENITNIAKDTVGRIIPRRVSRAVNEIPRIETEAPQPQIKLSSEGLPLDVSTRGDIQRIESEISGTRKAKEIAKELGISTQKWVALRKRIRSGDLYGDALLEKLGGARTNLENSFEKFVSVEYTYTNPDGTHTTRSGEVVYFPNEDRLREKLPQARAIKTMYTFSDAKNYWGQIGGGAEYFGIVSIGNGNYQVVDLRDQKEYNNRGKIDGEIRAKKILKNLGHGRIENEDE